MLASAYERAATAEWVSGACMLVRRDAYEAIGGFDEGLFLYCEDTDLCLRLWQAGRSVAGIGEVLPVAEVIRRMTAD